jgi:hypothetical protein
MVSLGGGMPHPDTFPFASMQLRLKLSNNDTDGILLDINATDMNTALQYSGTVTISHLSLYLFHLYIKLCLFYLYV